jgi:dienelactone hydrolase
MKMTIFMLSLVSSAIMITGLHSSYAKIEEKNVEYSVQGKTTKGFLAYDNAAKEKRPGVIVVHEWWGLNDYARMRARMLAKLGYVALALDMYGDGRQATHPDDAAKFSSEIMKNFDTGKARFNAALDFLKSRPNVDPDRIAAVGYCFGGGVVLNMARQGADLKAAVSFHGGLTAVRPAEPGEVKAKILVLHGGADKFSTPEQIAAFKKEMTDAGADFKFVIYPGAWHAFTNPAATALGKKFKIPIAYNASADKKSWAEMSGFMSAVFKK